MIRRCWMWVFILASLRLAHINLLWADEDYHLAAALQIWHGRTPYRDFWYDKPPLAALFYSLIGGHAGWPLRFLDIAFVLACCWIAYQLAKTWWGEREGQAAALLLAFFTTFYLTSATIPLAVDGLLLLPHLAALCCAFRKFAFWCGVWCAIGLLTNVKAIFVVATCALWLLSAPLALLAGLLIPLAGALAIAASFGLLPGFEQQVWQWGLVYVSSQYSVAAAIRHCVDWLAFHATLVTGAVVARNESIFRFGSWMMLSAIPLVMGNHFAPRYFFQLLPVLVILGSRGLVLAVERWRGTAIALIALTLIVPIARFGPRYAELFFDNLRGHQTQWADAALDIDSQQVANLINAQKHNGNTLFVWGYRPDIYVYTRLTPDGKFSDSQPLDGVPADRHLESSNPSPGIPASANRSEFVRTAPTFLVDGLGRLNPQLSVYKFPDLENFLSHYRPLGQTKLSQVWIRIR